MPKSQFEAWCHVDGLERYIVSLDFSSITLIIPDSVFLATITTTTTDFRLYTLEL